MQLRLSPNFITAATITTLLSAVLFYLSFSLGKNHFFLLLNNNLGVFADAFFTYYTYLGDGIVWAILLVVFIKYNKQNIVLLISAFVICTILVQVCKYIIVPDALRPISAIQPKTLLHMVAGVQPHETASFPSGHTSAAFSFFLIGTLFIRNKLIIPIGLIYASLVGYSRVYLAQHFPFDVAAGMLVAVITVLLSVGIQNIYARQKALKK